MIIIKLFSQADLNNYADSLRKQGLSKSEVKASLKSYQRERDELAKNIKHKRRSANITSIPDYEGIRNGAPEFKVGTSTINARGSSARSAYNSYIDKLQDMSKKGIEKAKQSSVVRKPGFLKKLIH